MSKQPILHLHPITIAINFVKQIKSFLIPMLIIVFSRGIHFTINPKNENFYPSLITAGATLFFLFILLLISFIQWRKFVYWFEEGELRIEDGLFIKKKRYIPFERIQTLNYKEGILHRPFKLVKVEIETAGDNAGDAEAVLTAVSKEQAKQVEIEMKKSTQKNNGYAVDENDEIFEIPEVEKKRIYTMSKKDLVLLATTSSSMGILFSGLAAIASQFNDLIPYEEIYGEVKNIVRFGIFFIIILVLVVILLSWLVAIAISFIVNYDFRLEKQEQKLFISKGLLEKKSITLPMQRIQGIRIVENPIRQIFGYCRVVLDSAGSSGDEKEDNVVILPFIKKKQAIVILEELFPRYEWDLPIKKVPRKALLRYLLKPVYFLVIPLVATSYFLFPYGVLSLLFVPIFVLWAYWKYRTAGFALGKLQLLLIYRGISRVTFVTTKNKIQSMTLKQSYFAERKDIASIQMDIMSSDSGFTGYAKHFDLEDMQEMMEWYKPN
ncbi:MAG: PH domain-containing protein [Kurthia sp.]|nr:PH domain-containing protein [Candidatus Kurthia equi]